MKYIKVLQGVILPHMKLLAVRRRAYFHENFHFSNQESQVNRKQKQL